MTRDIQPNRICYLVLIQPALVAMDIAQTLADHAPRADIIMAQTEAEALLALASKRTLAAAFIRMSPKTFERCDLSQRIHALGGQIILLGEAAEQATPGQGWRVLMRPFTSACVLTALQRRDPTLEPAPRRRAGSGALASQMVSALTTGI